MQIYVSGSLAFDRIMDFPGRFSDHILPEKIHILNVSFLVNGLEEKCGGTAGNVAYSLALLGEKPLVLSAVGKDFASYEERFRDLGLPVVGLRRIPEEFTAGAYITTDLSDNQITGFNPGAMKHPSCYAFPALEPARSLAIASPGNMEDMMGYTRLYRERGVPFLFDPGQQIPAFSGEQLLEAMSGAETLISNDYELEMIMKATGMDRNGLLARCRSIITTLGEKGSVLVEPGATTSIPAAKPARVLDPTGAGDAYRSGLIKGLCLGKPLAEAAKMGSVCASFCVEHHGTQAHSFTMEQFRERYKATFGALP